MSVPPGSQWQHCGDGFVGVDKFSRLLSDVDHRTPAKCRTTTTTDHGIVSIVTDTTPKSKAVSHFRNKQGDSSVVWKREDFLQDFYAGRDLKSQTEDITWSSSSSDECSPVARCPEIRKRRLREPSCRKKKRLSACAIDISDQAQTVSPAASQLSIHDTHSPTHQTTGTVISDDPVCASGESSQGQDTAVDAVLSPGISISTFAQHVSPVRLATNPKLCHQAREKQGKMSWTLSSFDDIKQMSSPRGATLPVTQSHKLNLSHGTFSRCRHLGAGVEQSRAGESQESVGQISEVESDTELETVDIDADIVGSDIETTSSHGTSVGDRLQPSVQPGGSLPASVQEDEEKISQVDISSGTTSPSSSSHSEKMRASEWIKALQTHKTPEKADQSVNCHQDSGKKSRKSARGSMAEQLARLITREKASIRFWHHSVKSGTLCDTSSRSLMLRLQSLEKQYSLFMSRCLLIAECGGPKLCHAMFTSETVHMLSLKPGMLVQVFAPWQQLEEDSGLQTFLCTHYVRVSPLENPEYGQVPEEVKRRTSTSACWKCPCSTEPHLPPQACQASLHPVLPLQIAQLKPSSDPSGCSVKHSTTLHTVTALPDPSVSQQPKQTLLERVRGDSSILPPFTATVLRVFRHRGTDTWEHRFQLLVEDAAGTLAIIRLATDCPEVNQDVCQAEGQTYTLSHLQVIARTNRDKEPALFRIIDQLWTGQCVDVSSQQSGSEASQVRMVAPGFAYVLHSVSAVASMSMNPGSVLREASVRLITLKEALQVSPDSRVSFVARALLPAGFCHSHREQGSTVFVYDASVQLAGDITGVQRVEVDSECIIETSSSGVYLFRDVRVHQGHMRCDGFTLVLEMASWGTWSLCGKIDSSMAGERAVSLPPVSDMSEVHSLVSLQGVVSGVDEEEAYSWEECGACGSDRLATLEETGVVYCTACNSQVMQPVTRMKMKVFVTCKNFPLPDLYVHLDLAQATIESLLPSEQNEEGFDTQQVVGKPIKCPACVVVGRVHESFTGAARCPKVSLMLLELTN